MKPVSPFTNSALNPSALFALAIILLLLLLVYPPVGGDQGVLLGRGDLWGQFAPMAFYLDFALSKGDWPQWNPLVFCGVPFAANPQSASYYPPHLIRALLNRFPTPLSTFQSIALMQTLHLLVLGMGVYFLCRRLGLTCVAAVAAACAVVLSATMTFRAVQHWSFIALAAHFPWQMLALDSLLRAQTLVAKMRWAILFGVLMASAILIGCPQILVYPVFCLGAFVLLFRLGPARPSMNLRAWGVAIRDDALTASIALAVALGLSAALLLPAAELATYCARAKSVAGDEAMANAVMVRQLHTSSSLFAAFSQYPGASGLRFLGLIGTMIVLCAVFYKRKWPLFLFAVLFGVMFDMALGPPMPIASLASWLSPLYLSEPERASIIGVILLSVLLGMGVDAVKRPIQGVLSPFSRAGLVGIIGIIFALLLFKILGEDPTAYWWMWSFPFLAIFSLTLAQFPRFAKLGAYATVCILLAHLALSARDYASSLAESNPYPGDFAALRHPAEWSLDNTRGIAESLEENTGMFSLQSAINGYDPLIPAKLEALLRPEDSKIIYDTRISVTEVTQSNTIGHNLLKRRFHLVRGYSTETFPSRSEVNFMPSHVVFLDVDAQPTLAKNKVEEKDWTEPLDALHSQPSVERENGGSFLLGPIANDARHRLVQIEMQNNGAEEAIISTMLLGQGQSAPSLAWSLAHGEKKVRRIPLPDWEDMRLHLTASPSADGIEIVSLKSLVDPLDAQENIVINETVPDSVTLQVSNENDAAWLLFTEYGYPGWNAYLDGVKTPIFKANVAFQAIEIPSGLHEVRFEFDSPSVRLGLQISLAAFLLTVLSLVVLWRIELKGGYRI